MGRVANKETTAGPILTAMECDPEENLIRWPTWRPVRNIFFFFKLQLIVYIYLQRVVFEIYTK